MISISTFIIVMIILNLLLPGTGLLLAGLFTWNLIQRSTNPAIQSGIIKHVEGDTSQMTSWNIPSLNAGIGVDGVADRLVMIHLSVEYVTYASALIGLISLTTVFILKNGHYIKNLWLEKVCTITRRSIFMISDLYMLSMSFSVFIYRCATLDVEVYNTSMVAYLLWQNKLSQVSCYNLSSYHVGL